MLKRISAVMAVSFLASCTLIPHRLPVKITVLVTTVEPIRESESVYIVGNQPEFGNWQPDRVPLQRLDALNWTGSFLFEPGTHLEYKITKGNWQKEAVIDGCATPTNSELEVRSSKNINITVRQWKDDCADRPPEITGTAIFHGGMTSQFLENPRDVVVWLPPSYGTGNERYPVLYMHDGQNLFDPNTSTLGFDWRVDEIATDLITTGKMKEIIIVGVYNTDQRTAEYSPMHLGPMYARFLIEELKPFIDAQYRTLTGPDNTAVMGSSMGGIISFDLTWEHPEVFGMAGCMSSAFLVDGNEILKRVAKVDDPPLNVKFYLDNGTLDVDHDLVPGFHKMTKLLREKGYSEGVNLLVFEDEGATHNEMAWSNRVHRPLLFFFGKEPSGGKFPGAGFW